MAKTGSYIGKVGNSGAQKVDAPLKITTAAKPKKITGRDLRVKGK